MKANPPNQEASLAFQRAGKGSPRMVLKARSLMDTMLMECMAVAEHGARFAKCENCGDVFLTGPLTWRRSHARFCSDKCRVAAMRARNAKEESRHGKR